MTKFRLGAMVGFATGYYLGTKAGRQRYDQLNRLIGKVRGGDAVGKVRAVVELGRERAHTRNTGPYIDLSAATHN